MKIANKIKSKALAKASKIRNENETPLKEQEKILKKNIKNEIDMARNKKTYRASDGTTFGPEHYRKASLSDMHELTQVQKKLGNKEKINKLKKKKKKALSGVSKNIKRYAGNEMLKEAHIRNTKKYQKDKQKENK